MHDRVRMNWNRWSCVGVSEKWKRIQLWDEGVNSMHCEGEGSEKGVWRKWWVWGWWSALGNEGMMEKRERVEFGLNRSVKGGVLNRCMDGLFDAMVCNGWWKECEWCGRGSWGMVHVFGTWNGISFIWWRGLFVLTRESDSPEWCMDLLCNHFCLWWFEWWARMEWG